MTTIVALQEETQPTRPIKIKLRVLRAKNGGCELKTTHTIPRLMPVLRHMPKHVTWFKNHISYNLDSFDLAYGMSRATHIKAKEWADAITKAIREIECDRQAVDVELHTLTAPIYIAVGNAVLKAEVMDFLETGNRALPALRKKVIADAKDESDIIIRNAKVQATQIVKEANDKMYQIQREVGVLNQQMSQFRAEASRLGSIPEWIRLAGLTISWESIDDYYQGSLIQPSIHFTAQLILKRFVYSYHRMIDGQATLIKKVWKVVRPITVPIPLKVIISAPDGAYDSLNVIVCDSDKMCPHISNIRSCMEIADRPSKITSVQTLDQLRDGIVRTMEEVNLDSLLVHYSEWHPTFRRKIPKALIPYLKHRTRTLDVIEADEEIFPDAEPISLTTSADPDPEVELPEADDAVPGLGRLPEPPPPVLDVEMNDPEA
jgi:hypothetical protein